MNFNTKRYLYSITLLCCVFLTNCKKSKPSYKYPKLQKNVVIDSLFGKQIVDHYRKLENLEDSLVTSYLKEQNSLTNSILLNRPDYKKLLEEINQGTNTTPFLVQKIATTSNGKYFYIKKKTTEKFYKLVYREKIDAPEIVLYDPNQNSNENNNIGYIKPNWDGSKIIIGLNKNDKEFCDLKVLDVTSKKIVSDAAKNAWPNALGGIKWLPDNSGFIYTYIPVIDSKKTDYLLNTESVLHDMKTRKNTVIFSKNKFPELELDKEDLPITYLNKPSDKYVLVARAGVEKYRDTYYTNVQNLNKGLFNWKLLYRSNEEVRQFSVEEDVLYFRTSKNSPNFKICKTSLSNPDFKNPEVLISESSDFIITDFAVTKRGLFYVSSKNGVEANLYCLKDNKSSKIKLPFPSGHISLTSKGINDNSLWIGAEGWLNKYTRYKFDFNKNNFQLEPILPNSLDNYLDDITVKEIEVASHDGTKVPLSLVFKEGLELNGKNPLFITGYGAYGYSNSPYLGRYLKYWVKNGGIYAMAHVRGGGEKGNKWHRAGYKTTKPNTWKDLIACTEFLINKKYTSPKKVIVLGGSAGGIMVGKAITERPDLFSAGIIRVGMLNTLRLHESPNGLNNAKEFGNIKDSIEFEGLLKMDAYHSIKDGVEYPAMYLTAGMNDARVPAWQPAKFVARMQEASSLKTNKPILLDIDFKGGHGREASTRKRNEQLAKILTFALWQTGHPDYQLKE